MAPTASIKSGTSSSPSCTRSIRPPSPPSMYHCDFVQPKAPKPLPKIEKKIKPPKSPKIKAEPAKKAKGDQSPSISSRGFSIIWGVKGKRKVLEDLPPLPAKPISLPISPPQPMPSRPMESPLPPCPPPPSAQISLLPHSQCVSAVTKPPPKPLVIDTPPLSPIRQSSFDTVKSATTDSDVSSLPSPTSSSPPPTPAFIPSPDFHVLCEDDIRYRRMEKLTRTLGEQPPLDLVFPPTVKRTFAANLFPLPSDEPLFVGPQMANARRAQMKSGDGSTAQLTRRNSASLLSLPGSGSIKSSKRSRRPATASSSMPSTSTFASLSPINTSLVSRPITATLFTPSSSPVSTISSSRRPSTASAIPYDSRRDFYSSSPSPSGTLSRTRVPFASHESLSSATTVSSSSCYSIETHHSAQHEVLPPTGIVDSLSPSYNDLHGRDYGRPGAYSPVILGHPPSPITAKPKPIQPAAPTSAIIPRNSTSTPPSPSPTADDDLVAYEEGFAQFKTSPLPSPLEDATPPPKLRTFTRAPVLAAPPRPVRRKPPPTLKDYPSPRARPSTAPAPASPPQLFRTTDRRPSTPFIDTLVPVEQQLEEVKISPPGSFARPSSRRERRQGWSGEWNRDDMQDVIQKLRNLK